MVWGAMEEKVCSTSHGQPFTGSRSKAMISRSRCIGSESLSSAMPLASPFHLTAGRGTGLCQPCIHGRGVPRQVRQEPASARGGALRWIAPSLAKSRNSRVSWSGCPPNRCSSRVRQPMTTRSGSWRSSGVEVFGIDLERRPAILQSVPQSLLEGHLPRHVLVPGVEDWKPQGGGRTKGRGPHQHLPRGRGGAVGNANSAVTNAMRATKPRPANPWAPLLEPSRRRRSAKMVPSIGSLAPLPPGERVTKISLRGGRPNMLETAAQDKTDLS